MDTKTNEKYYKIVSGPHRDVLFDACKYACDGDVKCLSVPFVVAIGRTMPKDHPGSAYIPMAIKDIKPFCVEHKDGSGQNFRLRGFCMANLNSYGRVDVPYRQYEFKADYNAKDRTGRICLI